jgi:hypothetical protein
MITITQARPEGRKIFTYVLGDGSVAHLGGGTEKRGSFAFGSG